MAEAITLPREGTPGATLSLRRPSILFRLAPLVLVLPPLAAFLLARPSDERLMSLVPALVSFAAIVTWSAGASRPAPPRRALVATILLTVLAVAVLVVDARGLWLALFYYPALAAGLIGPARVTSIAVGGVSGVAAVAGWATVGDAVTAVEFALECVLLGIAAFAVSRLLVTNRELVAARAEMARLAAADERARIARDLHDLLGHGLSLITIKAELASRLLPGDPDRAAAEVGDIESVSRRALEDVRAAVNGYRRMTLASELAGAQSVLDAAGIAVEIDLGADGMGAEVEEALAWSVREGVTNIVRHSSARRVTLRTTVADGDLRLEVVNDGIVPQPAPSTFVRQGKVGGTGLAGLAERVEEVGGRLEAGAGRDGDFRLAVVIPMDRNES